MAQPRLLTGTNYDLLAQSAQRLLERKQLEDQFRGLVNPPTPADPTTTQPGESPLAPAPLPARAEQLPDPRSNPFWDLEDELKRLSRADVREQTLLPEDAYQTARDRLNEMEVDAIRDQDAGVKALNRQAEIYRAVPPQLDLTALAALVDAQTGSKFTQSYKRPESARERAAANFALEDSIQKQRGGFTKEQIALLRAQLGGYRQDQVLQQLVNSVAGTNKPPNQGQRGVGERSLNKEIRTEYRKLQDESREAGKQYTIMENALTSGDWAGINAILPQIAKRVGGHSGVLSNQDLAYVLPRQFQGDVAKFMEYIGSGGKVDATFARALKALIPTAMRADKASFNERMKMLETTFQEDPNYTAASRATVRAGNASVDNFKVPEAEPTMKDLFKQFMQKSAAPKNAPAAPKGNSMRTLFEDSQRKKGN